MNPFDAPPSTPAVSYEPPQGPNRRRGRMVGAALLGAGLVGAGAVGVSALASADDPELEATTATTATTDRFDTEDRSVPPIFDLDEDGLREFHECVGLPEVWLDASPFGEFDGDREGELPPLGELFGDELFGENFELFGENFDLDEMLGGLLDELDIDGEPRLGSLEATGDLDMTGNLWPLDDQLVVVLGPDGPTIIDLGEGDGSVTVERDADSGELTITTEGTASELDLEETMDGLLDELVPALPDGVQPCLDRLVDDGG